MFFLTSVSQNIKYTYRNFDERDGIRSSIMFGMAQDKDGFIWMGTDNGLHRYDGHRFDVIKSPLDNPSQNISNQLREVMYDEKYNRLWMLSLTDFQYLDLDDYSFYRWVDSSQGNFNLLSAYKYMLKVGPDEILFSIDGNLYQYDILQKTVKDVTLQFKLPKDTRKNYAVLKKTDQDHLAVIYPNYLIIKNLVNGKLKYIKAGEKEIFSDIAFDPLTKDYYIAAQQGLIRLDLASGKIQKTKFPYSVKGLTFHHIIFKVHLFDQNTLILSGMSGHIMYNMRNKSHVYFPPEKGDFESKVSASFLLNDREGNLWKSSINDYCNVLYHQNKKMLVIDKITNNKGINIEPYKNVRINENTFAFCGSGMTGVGLFHQETGKYQIVENKLNPKNVVNDVITLNDGTIYLATYDDLFSFDLRTKNFIQLIFETDGTKQRLPDIHYMIKTGEKSMAAVTADAILLLDTDQKKGKKIDISDFLKNKKDQSGYGLQPFLMYRNKIFLGGGKYLYEFDLEKEKIGLAWEKDTGLNKGLIRYVTDILEDPNGKLWLSTLYKGVILHDPAKGSWKIINKDNSCISSNNVNGLVLDPKNRMWVMNVEKSYLFEINTLQCITSKDKREGFPRVGYSANMEKGDNIMTFNNYPSIQILDFNKNPINLTTRPTLITSLRVNEKEMINVPLKSDTTLSFSHDKNNLSFSFTNLCFNNSHNNLYKYTLVGLDTSWHISNVSEVEYKRLPAGKYTLRLQGSNNEGIWDPHIQTVHFSISPVFYKSWWFITLMITVAVGLLLFYTRLKTNSIKSEARLTSDYQKKIAEIEMKALRAQMNPHFIFNSLNSIQKFIFEKDEYAASQYLTKFSRLIRLILDQSNQDFISVNSEIEMLKYYIDMERLRFDDKFSYNIIKSPQVPDTWMIPSMVIQPHVENAIWHGLMHKDGDCILVIKFQNEESGILKVTIEDNGIGRVMAEEMKSKQSLRKKSFGSFISRDRINYFSEITGKKGSITTEDLYDEGGKAKGTRIILSLPVSLPS
jgi:ligand-binding sensor domain-containing protein